MTLKDRVYICENPRCDEYLIAKDRDLNAAMNIKIWGIMATPNIRLYTPGTGEIQACGDIITQDRVVHCDLEVSMKQEIVDSKEPR